MLRYKHLKPSLTIYLAATLLLFLTSIGAIVIIIVNELNGFSSVQFLTCPLYTTLKLNIYLRTILQVCFILSIGATIFALGQFVFLIWQFIMLKKQTEQKGEGQENTFEELSFAKLVILYILNGMGFICLVPIEGSFLTLFIQFANCTDPAQNKSSVYFIPTMIGGAALLFQLWSLCMLLKLFYHYEHKDSKSQRSENQQGAYKQNKYSYKDENDPTNARRAQRQRELQQMQRMKQRIIDARKEMFSNNLGYNENGSSTEQGSPRPLQNSLLNKKSKTNKYSPDSSIYQSSGIIGSKSPKNKLPKEKRKKYGSSKTPNKYAHVPETQNSPSSNNNPNQSSRSLNQVNSKNPNLNDPSNLNNVLNPPNSLSSNLSSKKPVNSTKNPQISPQNSQALAKDNKNSSIKPNQSKTMTAEQISVKQKEVLKSLPKNHTKNIASKHQPVDVIFEESGSEEDGSQFNDKLLLSNLNHPKSNPKTNDLNPTSAQTKQRKGSSSLDPHSNNNQKPGYPNQSLEKSQPRSPNLSPNLGPSNRTVEFLVDQINLNYSTPVKEPIRVKYINSPYLKHLKNKNISPEERRNIKKPFLKIAANIIEFDSKNYEVTHLNAIDQYNQPETKNNPLFNIILPLPNTNPQNEQQNSENMIENLLQPIRSRRKSANSNSGVKNIVRGIIDSKTLQQENPIIEYVEEDENFDDRLQKILDFDKISKKSRKYIYNPFVTQNHDNEKLYLHKNKSGKGLLQTQNNIQSPDYDPFQDDDFDNANYGKMIIEDDGNGNPVLKLDRGNSKSSQNGFAQGKKNKKDSLLIDSIRSKHIID